MTPLHVLTGFLGAGKTTLLAHLVRQPSTERVAVLVNEIGDLALDHHLVETVDGDVTVLASGCVCCALRGELLDAVERLLELKPDRIVVETTGVADPAPLVHGLGRHPRLADRVGLAGVVTAVDAVRGEALLDDEPEARRQVDLADRIAITKIDLAPQRVASLRDRLHALAPAAAIEAVQDGRVPRAWLLDSAPLSRVRSADDAGRWLHLHAHGPDLQRHVVELASPVDVGALALWFRLVTQLDGRGLLRIKGIVDDGSDLYVLQSVQHAVSPPRRLERRPAGWEGSRLVLLSRGLPEPVMARLIAAAHDAASARPRR